MLPERFPPDDPREWLNRARSNLALAKAAIPNVYFEDLCFDAQQAAEKAIKGMLIKHGIAFPHVHDLTRLLRLLQESRHEIPDSVWEAERLTRFAVANRYPGILEPTTAEEYQEYLAIAEAVVRWAEQRLLGAP